MVHRALGSINGGYTLLEILVAVAVVGILAAQAMGAYDRYKERVRVSQAVMDISMMSVIITAYVTDNGTGPPDLAGVGMQAKLDPWGNPYEYMNLLDVKGKGSSRKDKKLNPLNSDFDLYSKGKDGDSKLPLSPKVSQDDVIRARDGRFVGLAADFDP
ncbi:MAG: prepilin-type N-terminal cleavage/methylation domain-containing protein [Usitatibacteraceae bacterium]